MVERYSHLSGLDVDGQICEASGLKIEKKTPNGKLIPVACPKCEGRLAERDGMKEYQRFRPSWAAFRVELTREETLSVE